MMTTIHCPNCGVENNDLVVVCLRCGSFIQARVPTLDLFDTVWQLIETPRKAMRKIALAVHKNYVILLSSLYGIGLAFFLLWFLNLGEAFNNLLYLLFTAILIGPALGIIHVFFASLIGVLVGRLLRARMRFSNVLSVVAYATVPLNLSIVFLLPIELMTFGLFMFAQNPSPFVIKPTAYIIFMIFDGLAILWSLDLLIVGIRIISNLRFLSAAFSAAISASLSLFLLIELVRLIV
jgi:hypothetical protein